MGIVQDVITLPGFIDKEFANVFLYTSNFSQNDFTLQQEEVESIHVVSIEDLQALFKGEVDKHIS